MNLNSIELQISIPRTKDAAILQSQSNHKPVHDQAWLAAMEAKKAEELRHKSLKVEESTEMQIKEDHSDSSSSERQTAYRPPSRQNKANDDEQAHHPYKGHFIDVAL